MSEPVEILREKLQPGCHSTYVETFGGFLQGKPIIAYSNVEVIEGYIYHMKIENGEIVVIKERTNDEPRNDQE